ncbi:MAG: hypothetical protein ABIP74_01300, partial [Candidatus Saccharimonas sp.]
RSQSDSHLRKKVMMMRMRRFAACIVAMVALVSLTACGTAVVTPDKVPSPGTEAHRLTGKVVNINVPDATDSYVALELQADGGTETIAYFCSYGQPLCRLLKVDDRVSYTAKDNWAYIDFVFRAKAA